MLVVEIVVVGINCLFFPLRFVDTPFLPFRDRSSFLPLSCFLNLPYKSCSFYLTYQNFDLFR